MNEITAFFQKWQLDELIRAIQGAHNALQDLEELSQQELDQMKAPYEELARQVSEELKQDIKDIGSP